LVEEPQPYSGSLSWIVFNNSLLNASASNLVAGGGIGVLEIGFSERMSPVLPALPATIGLYPVVSILLNRGSEVPTPNRLSSCCLVRVVAPPVLLEESVTGWLNDIDQSALLWIVSSPLDMGVLLDKYC